MTEYKVKEDNNCVIVEGVKDFVPKHIFECGQCFRWVKDNEAEGRYIGVASGKVAAVSMIDTNTLKIENTNRKEFYDFWYTYFDLGRDYSEIKRIVSKDDIMRKAVEFGSGIRILKQDFNEILISFIISANNRIPRIMNSVETLSRIFGEKICFNGREYYSFPNLDIISGLSVEDINVCKAGFRCGYIYNTSRAVNGTDFTDEITRESLMKLSGVGPKVADCILLFSGLAYDAFPTDVWVKRVMEELYLGREASLKEIEKFAKEYFGKYAGFAQQYLFYYARENKIGVSK